MIDKRVWGWMFFDWASQPFYTLGLTFVFGPYFAGVSLGYFLELGLEEQAAGARSQALWFWGSALSGLFIALAAPIIGAYADTTGRRMPWLVVFSVVFFTSAWALWYTFPDGSTLVLSLIAFNIALIAIEFALIFTNAVLPSLGTKAEIGRISGNGAALGYWGGVVSLFIVLLLLAENDIGKTLLGIEPILGLDPAAREGTRSVGPFIAVWFAVFMIPYVVYARAPCPPSQGNGIKDAMGDLMAALRGAYER
ncbi:MAG: MFS transporter, partial [Pseudomonadota bacterium]